MDASTIAALNATNRKRKIYQIFDSIDFIAKSDYNVQILTTMNWLKEDWYKLSVTTISNCRTHCFRDDFNDVPPFVEVRNDLENTIRTAVRDRHLR